MNPPPPPVDTHNDSPDSVPDIYSPVAATRTYDDGELSPQLKGGDDVGVGPEDLLTDAFPIARFENSTGTGTNIPVPPMAECDYDINPTELYQAIEARQWETAIHILKSEGNSGSGGVGGEDVQIHANTGDMSGIDQAKVWVVRKERDGKLRWRMMPIHASIIFRAPYGVVESILAAAPITAQYKDDQGMLPLHLAFRNDASDDVIDELITAFPTGIEVKDRKGRIPLLCGVSRGNANRWKLLGTYTALAVACERKRAGATAMIQLDKELAVERKIQSDAARLLKEQNDRRLRESEQMVAAVVAEVTRIRDHYRAMEEIEARTTEDQRVLTHTLKTIVERKEALEAQIMSNGGGKQPTAGGSNVQTDKLVTYNNILEEERKVLEQMKALETNLKNGSHGVPGGSSRPAIPPGLLDDDLDVTAGGGTTDVKKVTRKIQQVGQLLQELERRLLAETNAKAHIQRKLEDTIEKQLVLTQDLSATKQQCASLETQNQELRSHIAVTNGRVDKFDKTKSYYDTRIRELSDALRTVNGKLTMLVGTAMKHKTDVEAAFAVRERMLMAIAKQEADMVRAATDKDGITDIARSLQSEVEALLMKRSPLVGLGIDSQGGTVSSSSSTTTA